MNMVWVIEGKIVEEMVWMWMNKGKIKRLKESLKLLRMWVIESKVIVNIFWNFMRRLILF